MCTCYILNVKVPYMRQFSFNIFDWMEFLLFLCAVTSWCVAYCRITTVRLTIVLSGFEKYLFLRYDKQIIVVKQCILYLLISNPGLPKFLSAKLKFHIFHDIYIVQYN